MTIDDNYVMSGPPDPEKLSSVAQAAYDQSDRAGAPNRYVMFQH
jgi:hypothetical protein